MTKNSERKRVIISRKFSEDKHKIFVSTVILKNGRKVLEQFRVPVDTEVEIPIEIIEVIKTREIAKFSDNKQRMVNKFVVEEL